MLKNSELVKADPTLLGGIDRQRRYILQLNSIKRPCPNCAHAQNWFEASGIDIDDMDDRAGEPAFHCVKCHRALEYVVPLVSIGVPWKWSLVPIKVL